MADAVFLFKTKPIEDFRFRHFVWRCPGRQPCCSFIYIGFSPCSVVVKKLTKTATWQTDRNLEEVCFVNSVHFQVTLWIFFGSSWTLVMIDEGESPIPPPPPPSSYLSIFKLSWSSPFRFPRPHLRVAADGKVTNNGRKGQRLEKRNSRCSFPWLTTAIIPPFLSINLLSPKKRIKRKKQILHPFIILQRLTTTTC